MKQKLLLLVIISLICVAVAGAFYFKGDFIPFIKNLVNRSCALDDTSTKPKKLGVQRDRYIKCLPIEVYFKSTATDEEIRSLIERLNTMPNIYYVKYITREEAVVQYKQSIEDNPILLELAPKGNFLPATTSIYIKDPIFKESIFQFLKSQTFIDLAQ